MKPQCNTSADCLRELARVMEQFCITDAIAALNSNLVKFGGDCGGWVHNYLPPFKVTDKWQFAIAEVEGKPVFIGDELYYFNRRIIAGAVINGLIADAAGGMNYSPSSLTWNPPKPATVMVELTVEDASYISRGMWPNDTAELACKTALEKLKV